MGKSVMVNGLDITPYLTPWGYTVSYRKIQGGSSGTMLDGSFLDDVIAYKITLSAAFMPLTQEQCDTVIGTLYDPELEYAVVKFYDPRVKIFRTAECTFTASPQKERGRGADGEIRWTGLEVIFEER